MQQAAPILVVDPDERDLSALNQILTGQGYDTCCIRSGQNVHELVSEHKPRLCIIEPVLPDGDGFALGKKLTEAFSGIKTVFILSSPVDPETEKKIMADYGASGFLSKPYDQEQVISLVSRVLQSAKTKTRDKKLVQELDELLEKTLSGLEIDTSGKKKKSRAKPRPSPGKAPLTSDDIFGELIGQIESGNIEPSKSEKTFAPPDAVPEEEPLPELSGFGEISFEEETEPEERLSFPGPEPELEEEKPLTVARSANSQLEAVEDLSSSKSNGANQYEFLEKIAAGGMAEVWKAKLVGERGFEKIVAVKKILPHLSANHDFIRMFTDEARVAAKLTHPNIAQIYELRIGEPSFIAMEFVDGFTLREIINLCREHHLVVPPYLTAYIGMKLCNALHYAHTRQDFDSQPMQIVHRDVSPQNIIISHEGEIKLVDFGIAKASIKATETLAGSLKGKLQYMSPEQGEGRPLDARSDIFSLGIVLYEASTGRKLYGGDTELAILSAVRAAKYPRPRDVNPAVPEPLERILLQALSKEAGQRHTSAKTLENEFREFLKDEKSHISESDIADFILCLSQGKTDKLKTYFPSVKLAEPSVTSKPGSEVAMAPVVSVARSREQPPIRAQMFIPPPTQSPTSFGSKIALGVLLLAFVSFIIWFLISRGENTDAPTVANESEQTETMAKPEKNPEPEISGAPDTNRPKMDSIGPVNPAEGTVSETADPGAPAGQSEEVLQSEDEELKKMEEELRKKRELLENLKKGKDKKDN